MTISELKSAFTYGYNQEADTVYFTPGRINLICECFSKFDDAVLPTVLSFGIYLMLRRKNGKYTKFWSLNEP